MFKPDKIISLILTLLMVAAAAIAVNKTIFGRSLQKPTAEAPTSTVATDSIDRAPDGTVTIHTKSLHGAIGGYAGPVPLDIILKEGKISSVEALPNSETPSFFSRASELLGVWNGKTPREALDMKVDAISGATYSSSAIISNVRTGLAAYEGAEAYTDGSTPWKIWIALAVTLAACIVPLFVHSKIYHNVQLIANIAVLGFWCGQFLDYALILKYISSGFTWPAAAVGIVMLVAAFIYPIFGRPQHYCNHICPLGSAQQLMSEICGYKIKLSPKTIHALEWFRRILWACLMLLLWADCLTSWIDLELFQAFQFRSAAPGIIIAAALFVLLSAVVTRPYCRFVCPTGSLFKRAENIG